MLYQFELSRDVLTDGRIRTGDLGVIEVLLIYDTFLCVQFF